MNSQIKKIIINPMFVKIKTKQKQTTYNPLYEIPVCCICLEIIVENKHTCKVCNHFTHKECITKWKKISKKKLCPICRRKIKIKK